MPRYSYAQYRTALKRAIKKRTDLVVKTPTTLRYKTPRGSKTFPYLFIRSKEITKRDPILLIRATIHGDEPAGALTLRDHISAIADYAHKKGVKLWIFPLDNPSGFEIGKRYNIEDDEGSGGNNDFMRYEINPGHWIDETRRGQKFIRWVWSSDPTVQQHLPKETVALHRILKKLPLKQVHGVIDIHQDNYVRRPLTYQYAFGNLRQYKKIVTRIERILPVWRNAKVDSGYFDRTHYAPGLPIHGKVRRINYVHRSNANGFIIRHDGTLPDLFWRLGAEHGITIETTTISPKKKVDAINLAWIFGTIDLIAAKNSSSTRISR